MSPLASDLGFLEAGYYLRGVFLLKHCEVKKKMMKAKPGIVIMGRCIPLRNKDSKV